MEKNFLGIIFVILSAICFSAKAILVKLFYLEKPDPIEALFLRMAFALPFFLGIAIYEFYKTDEKNSLDKKEIFKILFLGFFGYHLSSLLDFLGLEYITAGLERLIIYSYPTIVLLLDLFINRKYPQKRQIISFILTYIGIGVIFFDSSLTENKNLYYGSFLVFLCTISYSWYVFSSEKLVKKIGTRKFTSYVLIVSCISVMIHYFVKTNFTIPNYSNRSLIIGLLMGIISTVIPTFLFAAGVKRIGSTKAALLGTVGPISTIILSNSLLDEPITIFEILGSILIIVGVILISRKKNLT
ncbi:MAG: DMT family transporter [Leptospiraceae bacterium]|nr:DMT family transporter [Leptospiraceae bacterium]